MKSLRYQFLGLALLAGVPSLVFGGWSLGVPATAATLSQTANIGSGGMTDQPSTAFEVFLKVGMDEYDNEFGTSAGFGNTWSHLHTATLAAPHDCPVSTNAGFGLRAQGGLRAFHSVKMSP